MIEVSAPGKVMIAGEWAVLEPGNPAVVAAVDRRARVEIRPSPDSALHLALPEFGIEDLAVDRASEGLRILGKISPKEKKAVRFLLSALEVALSVPKEPRPFRITTRSGAFSAPGGKGRRKLGFGSSAAVVVASVAGTLRFHSIEVGSPKGRMRAFKLAALAHALAQGGLGSGFDVAASVVGGVQVYTRYDGAWLARRVEAKVPLRELAETEWPGLSLEALPPLPELVLLSGWTGGSASTPEMIRRIEAWRRKSEATYREILTEIREVVEELVRAWRGRDREAVLRGVSRNGVLLRRLGEASGVEIETPDLRTLSAAAEAAGGAGKPSGAGGADVGLAVGFGPEFEGRFVENLGESGPIVPIPVEIAGEGFRIENDEASPL
ncbi:MAG: phosphomevalonate kinase [Planctomycetota bacterium]|jgi:phosphomevalonate kinase